MAPSEPGTVSTCTANFAYASSSDTATGEPLPLVQFVGVPAEPKPRPAFKPWATLPPKKQPPDHPMAVRFPMAFRPVTAFACGRRA